MLSLSALAGLAWADCPVVTTTTDLDNALGDARRALEQLDTQGFVAATDRIDGVIPCLGEPVTRHQAAEIHRAKGIRAVTERNPEASKFFAAARNIEPAYKFPSTLIPEGNPVRVEYSAFDLSTGRFDGVPVPAEGTLQIDGGTRLYRPTDWFSLAQYLGSDGGILWTAYLAPGMPLPKYVVRTEAVAPDPQIGVAPVPVPQPVVVREANPKVPFAIASIGSVVLTGVLYGLAGAAESQFKDPTTPDADLDALRGRANSLVVVSGFTGAAGVGLGVAAIVVRK